MSGILDPNNRLAFLRVDAEGRLKVTGTGGGGGGGDGANLGYQASPTGGVVTSDTGTDASLPLATGTNAGLMAPAQHTKLAGIATGATANATNAELRDRATHTGTQAAGTITGLATVATSGAYSDLSGLPTASLDVVDVSSSRSVTAADDGKMLRATTAITLTWPSGLSPQPNILVMPPASGSVSLAASGTTLNAASTTLTRSRAANPAGVAVMSQGANAYGVSGA